MAAPYLGQPVVYTARRGEASGGQMNMAAMVTRVLPDDVVNLVVFPDGGEPVMRQNVPAMDPEGFHCWAPAAPDVPKPAAKPAKGK